MFEFEALRNGDRRQRHGRPLVRLFASSFARPSNVGPVGVLTALVLLLSSVPSLLADPGYQGIGLRPAPVHPDPTEAFELLDESVLNIVQIGANAVALDLNWTQRNLRSSTFDRQMVERQLAAVNPIVETARARGLEVFLRSNVVLASNDAGQPAAISPSNPDQWFDEYGQIIKQVASYAEQHEVAMLSVGSRLNSLESDEFTEHWEDLIDDVRHRYSGGLTYGAAARFDIDYGGGFEEVPFWSSLDVIGIDANLPLTFDFNAIEEDLLETAHEWAEDLDDWLEDEHQDAPVIFTDIGYRSVDGGATLRVDETSETSVDLEEQAHAYSAILDAFQDQDWWEGGFWNGWSTDPHAGGAGDGGLTPQRKPAEEVLAEEFGGTANFVLRPSLLASWEDGFDGWHVPEEPPTNVEGLQLSQVGATEGATSLTVDSTASPSFDVSRIWTHEGSEAYALFQLAFESPELYVLELDVTIDPAESNGRRSQILISLEDDENDAIVTEVTARIEDGDQPQTVRVTTPLNEFEELSSESLFYELELGTDNDWSGSVFLDNLRLRSQVPGDVTNDAVIDQHDIDALDDALRHGYSDEQYDLNGDGLVDLQDRHQWLFDTGTMEGDFDLNGKVEFTDFLVLSDQFGATGSWESGDTNGNREIEFIDFLTLSGNFGEPMSLTATPEPAAGGMLALSLLATATLLRRRSWRPRG